MCYEIEIEPRDVMYFRDGKPIGASADGSGADWPMPSIFHSAMLSLLNNKLGSDIKEWEGKHSNCDDKKNVRFNFGGLRTWGPFPKQNGEIYFPTPADLQPDNSNKKESKDDCFATAGVMQPVKISLGHNNLPAPLIYSVASTVAPSKKTLGTWISAAELQKYMMGQTVGLKTIAAESIYSAESRPGIGINPETQTTEEGKFYSAEYLRLKQSVSMVAFADCEAKKYNNTNGKDVLQELFKTKNKSAFILGGQRGVAWLENIRRKTSRILDFTCQISGTRVKWTLLSPAYFSCGWRPGWINMPDSEKHSYSEKHEIGAVMLKEKIERGNMTRKEWRKKIADSDFIKAQLVAALVPKPIAVSGWKLNVENVDCGQPKATRLYVPAGAVYYFECDDELEAHKLANVLHGQTKSDLLGEHGFGLGVCSEWELNEI